MQFQPKKGLTLRIKSFAFFLEKKYSDFTKERFLASKSIQYVEGCRYDESSRGPEHALRQLLLILVKWKLEVFPKMKLGDQNIQFIT